MASTGGVQGLYFGLPAATLSTLLAQYTACLTAIAVAGQTYSISGRQFTRANLAEVGQQIMELNAALTYANGTRTTQVYARFNNGNGGQIPGPGLAVGDLT